MFGEYAGATSDAVMNKEISKEPIKWTPPKCIFVPIVLKMADVDHRVFDMATRLRFNPSNSKRFHGFSGSSFYMQFNSFFISFELTPYANLVLVSFQNLMSF